MLTAVISLLIYILIFALIVYLIMFVLGVIGLVLPPKIVQIVWVIFGLVVLLALVQFMLGGVIFPFPHRLV